MRLTKYKSCLETNCASGRI